MKLQEIIRQLSAQRTICIKELRKKLWEYAEPGYKEHHSVALLTNVLKNLVLLLKQELLISLLLFVHAGAAANRLSVR